MLNGASQQMNFNNDTWLIKMQAISDIPSF